MVNLDTDILAGLGIGIILFILFIGVIAIIAGIFEIIGIWLVFKKAGKKGWEAIIPYYNTWTLVNISGVKWWYFFLIIANSLVSLYYEYSETIIGGTAFSNIFYLVNLFAMYSVNYNITKKFNKNYLYALGMTILPFIFYPILGFSKLEFNNNKKVSEYAFIKEGDK